jgi:hypothetical protein
MLITRIDSDKEISEEAEIVILKLDGIRYEFQEYFGRLRLHVHGSSVDVMPGCANVITIKGHDD